MELVAYWRIVRRRLWILVGLLALVLASYLLLHKTPAPSYTAHMRFVVGVRPEESQDPTYSYDRYYTWLTAEYLLDDLSEVVKSQRFAQDVAAASGLAVPVGAIQGATSAGKLHRILDVTLAWQDPDELAALANAVVQVLETQAGSYFAQLSTPEAVISLIDPPVIMPVGPSLIQRLDLVIRLVLAAVVGLVLIFLLHYVDPTLCDERQARALGVPLLASIPRQRSISGWLGPLRRP